MTLAETASIFCETIIMESALEAASSPDQELAILETILVGDTRLLLISLLVICSKKKYLNAGRRLIFQWTNFARSFLRPKKPLMERVWTRTICILTCGPGSRITTGKISPSIIIPMPGLYAIYQQRGVEFVPQLQDLLASTGLGSAADLASRFDIDIRSIDFWEDSLEVIHQRIERYLEL